MTNTQKNTNTNTSNNNSNVVDIITFDNLSLGVVEDEAKEKDTGSSYF